MEHYLQHGAEKGLTRFVLVMILLDYVYNGKLLKVFLVFPILT